MSKSKCILRIFVAILLVSFIANITKDAEAAAELSFSRSGDDLTITAADPVNAESYWKLVLDESRGVITSFYDLTSDAGESWDFVCNYGYCSGLFAPFGSGIRNGGWDYLPGESVDGQSSYTYTLEYRFGTDDASYYLTTVTITAPTEEGTVLAARTECYYDEAATIAQRTSPEMQLRATDEAQANNIYITGIQDDLDIDGTLWAQAELRDTSEVVSLGLVPGRIFRITGLNLTDGTLDYDGASVSWSDTFNLKCAVTGGIYDGWASKPPAGALFSVYTRLDINITGDALVINTLPVAVAGEDQTVIDIENDGFHNVSLDASASYDSDGAIVAFGWTLSGQPLASGAMPTVSLPVGENVITLTVTDDQNASDTDEIIVVVEPRTPREFYVSQLHPDASDSNDGTDLQAPLETISAAMDRALNGDTITVHDGIYRERVGFKSSGTVDGPITLRAAEDERAVISGSDELTGWTQLSESQARGNTHFADIYYVDIDWCPSRLDEDEVKLTSARSPNSGWWVLGEGTSGLTIADSLNLTGSVFDYTGASVFFRNLQPVSNTTHGVLSHDQMAGTLTLDEPLADTATVGVDLYYLFNRLEMLDLPGEWAVEQIADTTWRVYIWPSDSALPESHMYEATRRNGYLLSWGNNSYIVIDGMEVRGGQLVGVNDSYAVGSSGTGTNVEVSNCIIHDNEYMGVQIRSGGNVTVRNCLIFANSYGVGASYSHDILIKNNEVYENTVDGVLASWNSTNVVIEGNYIHDHVLWGHPDNCQTYRGPSNVWFIDNVMINAGQGIMMEETTDVHFVNNIILGAHAYMLIIGHSNCNDVYLDGNTMAFSGYGLINNTSGLGRTFTSNIFYQGHSNVMFGASDTMNYSSDYNIFYLGDGLDGGRVVAYNSAWLGWDAYLSASGQDSHSSYADPMFANAPKLFDAMDAYDLPVFRADRVYLRSGVGSHAVGDYIEFDFDGVVRTITATGSDDSGGYIEYTPAHAAPLEIAGVVCNWRDNDQFELDLTLDPSSPALAAGLGGRDCGSTLDLVAFRASDFDGDGLRDVPVWPVESEVLPLPGDANSDGRVNLDDFIILKQNYGSNNAVWSQGDFNDDGKVNLDDFILLKQNYGSIQ